MCSDDGAVQPGLPTLDGDQLRIMRRLDETILRWARHCGFRERGFPPLTPVADLEGIDYFHNFPHLGLAVAPLAREVLTSVPLENRAGGRVLGAGALADVRHFLPSAACYPVYSELRGRRIADAQRITTVQRCFRNEDRYEGLVRLWSFTMRELVFVGPREGAAEFLAFQKLWIGRLAQALDVPLDLRVATDPFFEAGGQRARMQQLFPVKHEFVFDDVVAVASANTHRNFFGERWDIRLEDGTHAFTACVAFGLERWLHALGTRHAHDTEAILAVLDSADLRGTMTDTVAPARQDA